MSPTVIIEKAAADGVHLALSPTGTIKATGGQAAVSRWLPIIRGQKAKIVAALRDADSDAEERIDRMVGKLKSQPDLSYAIETHEEVEPEALILTVAIRGKGACEIRVPKSRYDAFALIELIEKYTKLEILQ